MNNLQNNKLYYMDEFYKTRQNLSLKYVNMSLSDMKAEIKKSTDKCLLRMEEIRNEKKERPHS